jgi:acetyl/propionyl-CoA carboxylase alpha subunit
LRRALDETWMPGVVTNREQLARILAHPAFLAGELDTHFLDTHAGELAARPPGLDRLRVAAIAATLHGILARREPQPLAPAGWRNVRFSDQRVGFTAGDADIELSYRVDGDTVAIAIGGKTTTIERFGCDGDRLWFVEHGGHRRGARVVATGAKIYVLADGLQLALVEKPRFPEPDVAAVAGGLTAPMPGKVVKVLVAAGEEVAAGAALVVLEAMKMEHTVRAVGGGVVAAIHVAVGDQVDADRLLAVVTA